MRLSRFAAASAAIVLLSAAAAAQGTLPGTLPGGLPGGGPTPQPEPQPAPPQPAPPQPGTEQKRLDAAAMAYFVGEWSISYVAQGIKIDVTAIYRADGTFIGYQDSSYQGYPPVRSEVKGTFTLSALDETRFNLTLIAPGSPPSMATLRIVDRDTLFNEVLQVNAYRKG